MDHSPDGKAEKMKHRMCLESSQILQLNGFPWEVQSKDPMPLKMVKISYMTTSQTLECVLKILARLSMTS